MTMNFEQIRAAFAFVFLSLVTGCASINYDAQADQQLTSLVQQVNQQFLAWEHEAEKPGAVVPYDAKAYDALQTSITTLEIRMEASQNPATEKLVDIFKSLGDQIETTRNDHKNQGTLSAPALHVTRLLLNVQLATLMTFELSLSGAQRSSTAKTDSTATATTQQAAKQANK